MEAADILQTLQQVIAYLSEVYIELSGQNAAIHVIIGHLRKSLDFLASRSSRQETMQLAEPSTPPTAPPLASATSNKKSAGSKVVPSSRPSPVPSTPPLLLPPPLQMPAKYNKAVKQYEEAVKGAWQSVPSLSTLSSLPSPSLFELQSNLVSSVSEASFEFERNLETSYRSTNAQTEAQQLFCAVVAAQRWILDALKLVSTISTSSVPVSSVSASMGIGAEDLNRLLVDLKGSREKLSRMISEQQVVASNDEAEGHSTNDEDEDMAMKWRDRFLRSMSKPALSKPQSNSVSAPLISTMTRRRRPIGCWLAETSWMPISDPAAQAPWLPLYPPVLTSSGFPIKLQCSLSQAISHGRAMHHLQLGLFQLHVEGSIARSLIPLPRDKALGDEEHQMWLERKLARCRLAHQFLVKSSWHRGMRIAEAVVEDSIEAYS